MERLAVWQGRYECEESGGRQLNFLVSSYFI